MEDNLKWVQMKIFGGTNFMSSGSVEPKLKADDEDLVETGVSGFRYKNSHCKNNDDWTIQTLKFYRYSISQVEV
jgi:hypothetical protein